MAVITVTTALDLVDAGDGVISLREALAMANSNADADTIVFASSLAGRTINLTEGELTITDDVTLNGDMTGDYRADITIAANLESRIFNITGGATDAILRSLTLAEGLSTDTGGGAIRAVGVNQLTILDSTIRDSGSHASGGALYSSASILWIGNTTMSGNISYEDGGGIYLASGNAEMQNVILQANAARDEGGGLFVGSTARVEMFSTTITGNVADGGPGGGSHDGGGIAIQSGGYLAMRNTAVVDNHFGYVDHGTSDNDIKGWVTSAAYSAFGTAVSVMGDTSTVNFGLVPNWQFWGASTLGRVPTPGFSSSNGLQETGNASYLPEDRMDLDHDGITAEVLSVDARGAQRVVGTVDIGAVEAFYPYGVDLYTALDDISLIDVNGVLADANALFDGDNETVVYILRTAYHNGQIANVATAQIAHANNLLAAAESAGHALDVRFITLDGTTELDGLSPLIDVLHLDRGDARALLETETLFASFSAQVLNTNVEAYALHRAPAATSINALPSLGLSWLGGYSDAFTLDKPLEDALAETGPAVDLATGSFLVPTATTTLGQFDQVGETVPNLVFTDHNGNKLNLRNFGSPNSDLIVVSFCTEWCAPCQYYSQTLEEVKLVVGADFKFLEVMLEDVDRNMATLETAQRWVEQYGTATPVVTLDDPGKLMDLVRGVNIPAFPHYLIVEAKTGKIIDTFSGATEVETRGEGILDSYYAKFKAKNFGGTSKNDSFTGGKGSDKISGGDGRDKLSGLNGNDSISGGDGKDTLYGGTGRDKLKGGDSADKIYGQDGRDSISGGDSDDRLYGGNGNDTISGGAGADTIDGGAGFDKLSYAGSKAVKVNLATGKGSGGDAKGDVISSIEFVTGSNGNDRFTGNGADNYLEGGKGNDTLEGGRGADTLSGGSGRDTVSYASATGWVSVFLHDQVGYGDEADGDVLIGIENIIGSRFGDGLFGDAGNNQFIGGDGYDIIDGGGGTRNLIDYSYARTKVSLTLIDGAGTSTVSLTDSDTMINIQDIRGGAAGDELAGDHHSNRLTGNGGYDTLTGGNGVDYFVFDTPLKSTSADRITDFVHNQDLIELSKAALPGLSKTGGLAKSAFYAAAGAKKAHDSTDRIVYDKSSGKLYYDADGKGGAGAIHFATLTDKPYLDAGDFLIV